MVRYIEILVVLFLLVVQEIDSVDRMRQVMVTIMLGGLIATLIGIGEFVMETSTTGSAVRIRGWHGGGFGAVAAVTFLIAGSAAILDRVPRVRLLGLCTLPLAGTALVLSGTRAWIGACGIAVITLMLLLRGPVMRRVVVGVLLVLAIGFVVLGSGLLGRQEWNIVGGVVENTLRSAPKQGKLSGEDLSLMMRYYLLVPVRGTVPRASADRHRCGKPEVRQHVHRAPERARRRPQDTWTINTSSRSSNWGSSGGSPG